jgi:hypothetical protein
MSGDNLPNGLIYLPDYLNEAQHDYLVKKAWVDSSPQVGSLRAKALRSE